MFKKVCMFVSVRLSKLVVMMAMLLTLVFLWMLLPTRPANPASAGYYMGSTRLSEKSLYKLDIEWPKFPRFFTGQVFGVAVDPVADIVYVAQRGESVPKILMFTEQGYFLHGWNTTTIELPHGIFATSTTPETTLWVTDVGNGKNGHTIKQYSSSGELLRTLGTPGIPGSSLHPLQFDQPAEVFISSKGEMYIVDGDGGLNNRLIKLEKGFDIAWMKGEKGDKPSQFYIPHSVTGDNVGRVWVADRGNKRLQAFDAATGEWIGAWSSCFTDDAPSSVRLTHDNKYFVVAQLKINRVVFLSVPPIGNIGVCYIVDTIQLADDVKPHLVDVSRKTGAIYVAEIGAQQAQKFVPNNRK
ncbi:NHL repeat-containing protein 3-like [Pristis pectinata]|uniref:NHL repeat-containing protein 3-like n=1 Tax=Pristis pectinata TaxID=685728 RepID=UPI00223D25C4|nr:NHL repeat-containing protein 3-like [Pristis pectinata]XP_051881596.1 NHL repeat-containing protein 3-like [Pristis pectinata]XP_051881597.1 NHL repeat-containing protein 3-like [Pristis pectinata]XP_051881598.1 NHL repeat-containing protein 3-like [Pristis pectinata]XP_051881599.1 NHL repeat-containing protein 3-like [Pristis pectinata]XP_051881600.1 NHL repeat-containing protein 3-like [Pristis pectinata]XP_051881601.1 NHL repeat-containing protein 3-like [Pristis pectinata]XP_05188160